LDDLYLKSEQGQEIFLFSKISRLALGPTQPLIQWAWGALSRGVKQVGHEADIRLVPGIRSGAMLPLPVYVFIVCVRNTFLPLLVV
jgi:hypothetical protein